MLKLNCDMAEGYGAWSMGLDEEVMPYIDMANIACGFHASDPTIMSRTVRWAKQHGVSVGAHPSYPDLQGFGRRDMNLSAQELTDLLHYQIGALQAICSANDVALDYVKPHGALYNLMMRDDQVLLTIMKAVSLLNEKSHSPLCLMVLANNRAETISAMAEEEGLSLLFEAFCDRAYNDDGSLVSRSIEGAVFEEQSAIEQRVRELFIDREITCLSGNKIPVKADTLCVHGDNKQALEAVKMIRQTINQF